MMKDAVEAASGRLPVSIGSGLSSAGPVRFRQPDQVNLLESPAKELVPAGEVEHLTAGGSQL